MSEWIACEGRTKHGSVPSLLKRILLAPGSIPFAFMSLIFPSFGPDLKSSLEEWKYIATGGVLVDDSSSGSISRGFFGMPNVRATLQMLTKLNSSRLRQN